MTFKNLLEQKEQENSLKSRNIKKDKKPMRAFGDISRGSSRSTRNSPEKKNKKKLGRGKRKELGGLHQVI